MIKMPCTLCSIKEDIRQNNKGMPTSEVNLIARIVFEKVNSLSSESNITLPAKLERCVKDVMAKQGYDKSKAYAICTASLQKAGVMEKGKSKESSNKYSMDDYNLTEEQWLQMFENLYMQQYKLMREPFNTMEKYNKIRDGLYKLEDDIWKAERNYKKESTAEYPDEEILKAKLKVRKAMGNSEDNTSYENHINVLSKIAGKPSTEIVGILEKELKNISPEIIKDLVM